MHLSFFKLLVFWWIGYTCQTLNNGKVALCDHCHFSIVLQWWTLMDLRVVIGFRVFCSVRFFLGLNLRMCAYNSMNGHIDEGPTLEHLSFMLTIKLIATHVCVLMLWMIQQLANVSLCIKYICFLPSKLFMKG
jgi:hypothetical protein